MTGMSPTEMATDLGKSLRSFPVTLLARTHGPAEPFAGPI